MGYTSGGNKSGIYNQTTPRGITRAWAKPMAKPGPAPSPLSANNPRNTPSGPQLSFDNKKLLDNGSH